MVGVAARRSIYKIEKTSAIRPLKFLTPYVPEWLHQIKSAVSSCQEGVRGCIRLANTSSSACVPGVRGIRNLHVSFSFYWVSSR